jgi:hypothetical protein
VWLAFYARWKYFPWNDYVRTTVAASTGVNYAYALHSELYAKGGRCSHNPMHTLR